LWKALDKTRQEMRQLVDRRRELVDMRVRETNRSKAPEASCCCFSFQAMTKEINNQIKAVEERIDALIKASTDLQESLDVLATISGIGKVTAIELMAAMPELGTMNAKQAASLAGLAPHPRDSGTIRGKRSIKGGRRSIRSVIFMAALAAAHAKGPLSIFYKSLLERGKIKMVALTAVARKLIVIANARLRDYKMQKQS
jgi:transposase